MKAVNIRLFLAAALAAAALVSTGASHAQRIGPGSYVQTIVVEDVAVQYIRGEIRFCERQNVKGLICQDKRHPLGKMTGRPMARDWWSPESYVAAITGTTNFTIEGVNAGYRRNSLAISFYFD